MGIGRADEAADHRHSAVPASAGQESVRTGRGEHGRGGTRTTGKTLPSQGSGHSYRWRSCQQGTRKHDSVTFCKYDGGDTPSWSSRTCTRLLGNSRCVEQRKLLLPGGTVLEMVGLHEGQTVAVEHEADVDEENAITRTAIEELLFEQLPHAALIGAVADA